MSHKEYLKYKLYVENYSIPKDFKFSSVEKTLDHIGENTHTETWDVTAKRIKDKYPNIAEYLFNAYKNYIKNKE